MVILHPVDYLLTSTVNEFSVIELWVGTNNKSHNRPREIRFQFYQQWSLVLCFVLPRDSLEDIPISVFRGQYKVCWWEK